MLSSPKECLMNSSNGTPIIVIIQDNLLGSYLMSKSDDDAPFCQLYIIDRKLGTQ